MTVTDPRPASIGSRFARVGRVLAVTGGKGGIGKSAVASTLALVLADGGTRVGLLDLDLTGPCDHLFLGLDDRFPTEEFGIEPPSWHGIRFMTVAYFLRDSPAALRGTDVTNALLELLAICNWGELDVLVVDLPPGLGDATLDLVRLLRGTEYLLLCTPSRVVVETVRKTLGFHAEQGSSIAGVIENQATGDGKRVRELAAAFDVPFLGRLAPDPELEPALGDVSRLRSTRFAVSLRRMSEQLLRA